MKYKGYHGQVNYDEEAKIFHGEVVGLRDVITFQGTSVDELEQAFKDSIDEYLDFCKELERAPEKPFSGKLILRLPPEIHERAAYEAKCSGVSLKAVAERAVTAIFFRSCFAAGVWRDNLDNLAFRREAQTHDCQDYQA